MSVKISTLYVPVLLLGLAACSTMEERLAECQSHGISRDTCYLAERSDARSRQALSDYRYRQAVIEADKVKARPHH